MNVQAAQTTLRKLADPEKAQFLQCFFKTGPGEYAEGDCFLGITVPQTRKIARQFASLPFSEIQPLLHSRFHEERLLALIILTLQFKKADPIQQKEIFYFYLEHRAFVNNWDLVDTSAPLIVGGYLCRHPSHILEELALSTILWDRRIAMLSTLAFIRQGNPEPTLKIAKILLHDKHDLMHKAVGWMLREALKKKLKGVKDFLDQHYQKMPRTMLRYAIEHFQPDVRQAYLKGKI